ncbi:hypothetical protein J437_LFUL013655 [Ladona fulva]|uniref:Fatty acyl-CoA reductase n=1 Tax=Ladona fulva TaxID=123851 RepID=A0A8K0KFC4_LADFU|nr:hypothetical protein J437_LFUL013655 [Ladona fulva]
MTEAGRGAGGSPAPTAANTGGPIRGFFRDRCILVTGATGFMGKVLVEKLLRSCPEIRTIYLLVRPKRGNDVRTRLEELLNASVGTNINLKELNCLQGSSLHFTNF